jgi:hypothetical protein
VVSLGPETTDQAPSVDDVNSLPAATGALIRRRPTAAPSRTGPGLTA